MLLKGKKILVTGASSGIGREIAKHCSKEGAELIISGRNKTELEKTSAQCSGQIEIIPADLTSKEERSFLVDSLSEISGVVLSAGVVNPFPIKFLTEEKIKETMEINFTGSALLVAQLFKKKKILPGTSFVFLSSISSEHPHKGGAIYSASKSALESFSKVVALEYATLKIRSNCIRAAMVKTDMYDHAEENMSKASMDDHISKYPLGVGEPKDVANFCIYLLSEQSRWITGKNFTLDGGFLLSEK